MARINYVLLPESPINFPGQRKGWRSVKHNARAPNGVEKRIREEIRARPRVVPHDVFAANGIDPYNPNEPYFHVGPQIGNAGMHNSAFNVHHVPHAIPNNHFFMNNVNIPLPPMGNAPWPIPLPENHGFVGGVHYPVQPLSSISCAIPDNHFLMNNVNVPLHPMGNAPWPLPENNGFGGGVQNEGFLVRNHVVPERLTIRVTAMNYMQNCLATTRMAGVAMKRKKTSLVMCRDRLAIFILASSIPGLGSLARIDTLLDSTILDFKNRGKNFKKSVNERLAPDFKYIFFSIYQDLRIANLYKLFKSWHRLLYSVSSKFKEKKAKEKGQKISCAFTSALD
ncbi:hypothetical protein F5887DRAFT_918385 [Amanita rubescens]|nr:hypothetical protein F5887DRAFT_918385 [Amanita rubescens]